MVIPHGGIRRPREIPANWLSSNINQIIENETDWHTALLYDFRQILSNRQLIFPINQVFINACRHPKVLDDCVPLAINRDLIYRKNPSIPLRRELVKKYIVPFHEKISATRKSFILEGHSFVKGSLDNKGKKIEDDITLSDFVNSYLDLKGGIRTAPEGYLDFYAEELRKRLSGFIIGKNSVYTSVYDHILSMNSWDGKQKKGNRVPTIHQETDEGLYVRDKKPDMKSISKLRRAFADSLYVTMKHFSID